MIKYFIGIFLMSHLFILGAPVASVAATGFQEVTFTTEDGASIEGAFFAAEGERAVVFAHGAVFDRESWYQLAELLKRENI